MDNNPVDPALELEIKQLIISTLDLEEISPHDIDSNAAIFVEGLGLDSIDALELGVSLQRQYGIKLDSDSASTKQHFASVSNLCKLVASHREER